MASSRAISAGSHGKTVRITSNVSPAGSKRKTDDARLDRMIDQRLPEANRRGTAVSRRGLACAARYLAKPRQVRIELTTGAVLLVPANHIQGLADAALAARRKVHVDGSGYSLHWPALDLDVSVPGLVAGLMGNEAWMSELARRAGRSRSPAKAKSARENGRKGGRPPKTQC